MLSQISAHLSQFTDQTAIVYENQAYSYQWLAERVKSYSETFESRQIQAGTVVLLDSDYTPETLAIFLALLNKNAVVMPLTQVPGLQQTEYANIAQAKLWVKVDSDQCVTMQSLNHQGDHPLVLQLKEKQHPGLIIMSSGSTGKSKAILHDMMALSLSFKQTKKQHRVLSFLLFDHIGGINTMMNALYSGNALIVPEQRTPGCVSECIAKHHVDTLITSPSFLNLMWLQGKVNATALGVLNQVNYGSEVMPEVLLSRLKKALPQARFNQAYGLSELGVIRAKSSEEDSRFIKIDSTKTQYRIRNDKLEIKSNSTMLGYLNAPAPLTEDGWFMTGDTVEVQGDTVRILGRASEMINVGGEKVYPVEIENTLLALPEVEDVIVVGESNAVLGQCVVANIKLKQGVDQKQFKREARQHCLKQLPAFKVPQKFILNAEVNYGKRYKKNRKSIQNYSE